MEKETKSRIIKKYIFIFFLVIAIAISLLLMIVYNEKGEVNMPFTLEKIEIKSSIATQNRESTNLWDFDISQNNDIYMYIKKNEKIAENNKIKDVKIENIKTNNKLGKIRILLPTSQEIKTNFAQSTDDYKETGFQYIGSKVDNMQTHEICQNGGLIAFRINNQGIGEYISNEGEEIKYGSPLLEKAKINEEDIQFTVEFDIIIETTNEENYKGTINFNLPVEKFGERGSVGKEITDFSKVVFKRIE